MRYPTQFFWFPVFWVQLLLWMGNKLQSLALRKVHTSRFLENKGPTIPGPKREDSCGCLRLVKNVSQTLTNTHVSKRLYFSSFSTVVTWLILILPKHIPAIATDNLYFFIFILSAHYVFRPLRAILRWNTTSFVYLWKPSYHSISVILQLFTYMVHVSYYHLSTLQLYNGNSLIK
jgi:hypothetical protein